MFLKKIVQILLIILFASTLTPASDDILDEIGNDLDKKDAHEEQKPYLINLFDAMKNKDSYILYKEIYLSSRYSSELKEAEGKNSLGFILFGTFSSAEGQIGDMNVQFRAANYNNQFAFGQKMPREYTKNLNEFKIELHNAYIRLRALPPMLNVRIGHFYVPYGIQPWIDTHGTLLQSPAMEFTGVDRDWGIGFEGQNNTLEYQLGLTRGSGMDYFERDNNYVAAGKISTPRIGEHLNEWIGISFLKGKIYDPMGTEKLRTMSMDEIMGNTIDRWRTGIDGQKIVGPTRLRFEVSTGQDEKKETVLGEFIEANYSLGRQSRWATYFQFENLSQNINRDDNGSNTTIRTGLTYNISANYNVQLVASKDLNTIFGKKDTWIGILFYSQNGGSWINR